MKIKMAPETPREEMMDKKTARERLLQAEVRCEAYCSLQHRSHGPQGVAMRVSLLGESFSMWWRSSSMPREIPRFEDAILSAAMVAATGETGGQVSAEAQELYFDPEFATSFLAKLTQAMLAAKGLKQAEAEFESHLARQREAEESAIKQQALRKVQKLMRQHDLTADQVCSKPVGQRDG